MIQITLSEKEILSHPNSADLGDYIREIYWQKKEISQKDPFDVCVICGKQSPYRRSTHIDLRQGYVEGAGQGCFQESQCRKYEDLTRGLH